ncbi:MAG: hypothetical protein AAF721_37300 [Myxococcota bacterium]
MGRIVRRGVIAAAAASLLLGLTGVARAAGPPTLPGAGGTDLAVADNVASVDTATSVRRPPIQRPDNLQPAPIAAPQPAEPLAPQSSAPTSSPTPSAAPTSSPAPAPAIVAAPAPVVAPTSAHENAAPAPRHDAGGLAQSAERKDDRERFPHRGAVADFRLGAFGCLRSVCNDAHGAKPGVRLDGFLGGNIRGFVELGLAGGWGALTPEVESGANVLSLYGLDPYALQSSLLGAAAALAPIDFGALAVTGNASLRSTQVGPVARIHFVPRGRALAFVGAGVEYNLFRSRYDTALGAVKLDLHGLAVPIEAGVGVHVHKNIALVAQFDYLWTWYGLAVLDNPIQRMALPVSALDSAAQEQGADFRGELPQFWNVGIGIRGRM